MSRYQIDDKTIVDTEKAVRSWEETTYWDGRNHISKPTGSQWEHQTLYLSSKGRYYMEHSSDWQGTHPSVEWVSPEEAARWLLFNDHELPEDLADLQATIEE